MSGSGFDDKFNDEDVKQYLIDLSPCITPTIDLLKRSPINSRRSSLNDAPLDNSVATVDLDMIQQEIERDLQEMLKGADPRKMPSGLANALVSGDNHKPNAKVRNLIANVAAEQCATTIREKYPGVKIVGNRFSVRTTLNNKHVRFTFDTLEEAVLAYVYTKSLQSKPDITRYSEYYKKLYDNLEERLQYYKTKGVDIKNIVNNLLGAKINKSTPDSSSKRHKPT